MRRKVIAGNWKMNMLPNETIELIEKIIPEANNSKNEIILCVPYIDIFYANITAQGSNIKIGAQNIYYEDHGAFTGEISGKMLKSVGIEYVIIGHSERRGYFNESDDIVNKKVKAALENDLKPIICVGESLSEKESEKTEEIIVNQTIKALEGIDENQIKNIIIAYEPIWAIGTGKTAMSEEANDAIKVIRNVIKVLYSEEVSENIIILYGGSVNKDNCKELFETSDIDGGLIGGASLKADDFISIINYNK